MVSGVAIECDTMDEALALAQRAGGAMPENRGNHIPRTPVLSPGASRWTEARMKEYLNRLKGNQRKLVDALLDNPEGRTDEQLLAALGLKDGRELAGVFTGMWKNAKKVGADPNDVYKKQVITIGDRRVHEYTVSESFRRVASDVRPEIKR